MHGAHNRPGLFVRVTHDLVNVGKMPTWSRHAESKLTGIFLEGVFTCCSGIYPYWDSIRFGLAVVRSYFEFFGFFYNLEFTQCLDFIGKEYIDSKRFLCIFDDEKKNIKGI